MALTTEEWEQLVRRYRAVLIAQAKTTLEKHPDYLEPTGFGWRRCKHSGHMCMEPGLPTLSHWEDRPSIEELWKQWKIQNAIDDAKHLVNVDWEKDEDDGDMIMIDWDSLSSKRCVALFKEKTEKAKIPKGFRGFVGKEPWYARWYARYK